MAILLNSIALDPCRSTEGKMPPCRLEDLVGAVADAGFEAVEVWQHHVRTLTPEEVERLGEAGDEAGVRFPILGVYAVLHLEGKGRAEQIALFETMLQAADILGSKVIKMFPGRVPSAELTAEIWDRSQEFMREVLDRSEGSAVLFTSETHAGTLGDDPETLLRFLASVGQARMKVCWQPYEFTDTDAAIELYDRFAPEVEHIHLQGRASGEMSLLEESDLDYRRILPHVIESGFDGFFSIEFVPGCLVEWPEQFNLEKVLENAGRDRDFIQSLTGLE